MPAEKGVGFTFNPRNFLRSPNFLVKCQKYSSDINECILNHDCSKNCGKMMGIGMIEIVTQFRMIKISIMF